MSAQSPNETCLSIKFSGAKKKKSSIKGDFKIIDVSIDKDGTVEYLGQNQANSQVKFFTMKMVVESPMLFSSALAFYQEQVKAFLESKTNSTKLEGQ